MWKIVRMACNVWGGSDRGSGPNCRWDVELYSVDLGLHWKAPALPGTQRVWVLVVFDSWEKLIRLAKVFTEGPDPHQVADALWAVRQEWDRQREPEDRWPIPMALELGPGLRGVEEALVFRFERVGTDVVGPLMDAHAPYFDDVLQGHLLRVWRLGRVLVKPALALSALRIAAETILPWWFNVQRRGRRDRVLRGHWQDSTCVG